MTTRTAGLTLGVIADDFTGATDMGSMLARGGMRVVQTIGVPSPETLADIDADAVIVALKSRSIPAADAIEQSMAACRALQGEGARQIYFKYCSTFDSTPDGNIGPVAEALARHLGATSIPYVPSLPENGRSVFHGHMFVFDELLSESGMKNHPLNPMSDSNLVRWLAQQTKDSVGLLPIAVIDQGAAAVQDHCAALARAGEPHVIADSVRDADFGIMAEAFIDYPLITGGSGLATALARRHGGDGTTDVTANTTAATALSPSSGAKLILAGSASPMTLTQIDDFIAKGGAARRIDPRDLATDSSLVAATIDWARSQSGDNPVLIYGSGDPEQVRAAQDALGQDKAGQDKAGALLEGALGAIAVALSQPGSRHKDGARRIIVAGGETSGAVVSALNVKALRIGPEIGPGVPWTEALDATGQSLGHMTLKSGNFGAADFFTTAFEILE